VNLIDSNHLWGLNDESQRNSQFLRPSNPNHDYTMAKAPLTIPPLSEKDKERFFSKIKPVESGCHEWQDCRIGKSGYGRFYIRNIPLMAHRVAYLLATGKQPKELHVCHHCDNPRCCRADHLFLGTQADNMRDRTEKGRYARGERIPSAILTAESVTQIRQEYSLGILTQKQISEKFQVGKTAIYSVVKHRKWKHLSSLEELGGCKNFRRLGERHPKAKLTAQMVQEIRTQYSEGRLDAKQLSEQLGVSRTNIYRIVKRVIWRSIP